MAYTTIDDPSAYFQIALWTGNGGTLAVTNDGNSDLQPDLLWLKSRSGATTEHHLVDTTRGEGTGSDDTPNVPSNADSAEYDRDILSATGITSDGFSLDGYSDTNANTATHVGWQWKANGGSTSSNDDGDYTSTVQANTTAGFSIVFYGDATSFSALTPANVGHGLGAVPKMILIKNLDGVRSWGVHHSGLTDASKIIYLEATNAEAAASGFMDSTAPTSSVFTVDTRLEANGNNLEYIAYCFAEVQGYSKFSSYTGNNSADGPFVYTGFKPAFVMIKRYDGGTNAWYMWDNQRNPFNAGADDNLWANNDSADNYDDYGFDALSNGFKIRTTTTNLNADGGTYIYMAFAHQPFVSSGGVPCTAR